MTRYFPFALAFLALACGKPSGDAACGFQSVAGAGILINQFAVQGQTLGTPPTTLPGKLVVRLVAGPAYPAFSGKVGSDWVIGMEGKLPENVRPGSGVLVMDTTGKARGVMLYESDPVAGAPKIGTVAIGSVTVPMIGIQLDPARFEDARCPYFPDSLLK
ncbi:MAG: hypothetical protein ABJD11_05005 [Gemmatimonadota bacterium]